MEIKENRVLRLQRGDILVVKRTYGIVDWVDILRKAGQRAGVDFDVPVVFVDDLDDLEVVRRGGQ